MQLDAYQDWVESVSSDRVNELGMIYGGLGLAGETGEVVEKIKKIVRDKEGVADNADKEYIALELGDVLWYVTKIANELDISVQACLDKNVEKINDRRINGKK